MFDGKKLEILKYYDIRGFLVLLLARQPPPPPPPHWVMASSFTRILDPTQRCTTGGRTPKDEWSARRRDPFWQHTTLTTDIYSLGVIRTHSLTRRAAADPRLRPRGHWDRQLNGIKIIKIVRNKSSERRNISWRNCIIATNLLRSSNN